MIARLLCAGKPDDEWLLWVQFGVQIDEREQTRSGIVKALCLAKQTAIRTICSTEQKEGGSGGGGKFYRFIRLICRQTTTIVWLLFACICFVDMGHTRRACFWVDGDRRRKKKTLWCMQEETEKTATGRGREVKLTSLLSETESGIVCSQHQSRLFGAICLYWPFILEFDNAALVSPLFPPSSISQFLPSTDRWNNEVTAAQCSRRDVTVDGRDPTVCKGWKLSLPHFFLSPLTSFPAGGG